MPLLSRQDLVKYFAEMLVLEAVDSHRDTWVINRSICSLFSEIESQLAVPESIGN
jgi:hypothetical protein